MGERMPEKVRVETLEAGLLAAAPEQLGDAVLGESALHAEPQPSGVGVRMVSARTVDVAIEVAGRLAVVGDRIAVAGPCR
jgi:hypothetical protein